MPHLSPMDWVSMYFIIWILVNMLNTQNWWNSSKKLPLDYNLHKQNMKKNWSW